MAQASSAAPGEQRAEARERSRHWRRARGGEQARDEQAERQKRGTDAQEVQRDVGADEQQEDEHCPA